MVRQGKGCTKRLHFDNFIISTPKITLYLDSWGMASPVWHHLYAYKWYPSIKALRVHAGMAHCWRLACMGVQLNCTGRKSPACRANTRKKHFKGFLFLFFFQQVKPQMNGFGKFPCTTWFWGLSSGYFLRSGGVESAQLIWLHISSAKGLSPSRRGRGDEEPLFIFIVLVLNDRLLVLSTELLL